MQFEVIDSRAQRVTCCSVPNVGEPAPNLEWTGERGEHHCLHELRGQPVIIAFFPSGWDPARPAQLAQYNAMLQRMPGGGRLVGASPDDFWFGLVGQSDACIAVHPSDMAVALAALDAIVQVQGPNGARAIPLTEFHRLPGSTPQTDTNLQRGELIVAVDLPASPVAGRSHYLKVRDRASYAFALVSAAVALSAPNGTIDDARIALGGVAHKPWRALDAERSLRGKPANEASFRQAAEIALADARGYAHNTFKIELARRTVVRAFREVMEA